MKMLSLLCLLLTSGAIHAVTIESCDSWKSKASQFMEWRQQGIPISQAVKDTSGNVSRGLLLRAYTEPRAEDYKAQFFAVNKFSQQVFEECQTAQRKQGE